MTRRTAANANERLLRFPGGELITEGMTDVAAGRVTVNACLVWLAWPRLHRAGLVDEKWVRHRVPDTEAVLYRLLRERGGNAYGAYQTLLRRLASFEHALDREMFLPAG